MEEECDVDVRIYHLERISDILNSPKMYGIRLDFLEIEMTKEEQVSFFASYNNEKRLLSIQEDIDFIKQRLYASENSEDIFSIEDGKIRTLNKVVDILNQFCEKIWFNRHLSLII